MRIAKKSTLTGKLHEQDLPITEEQMDRWLNGESIQQVFEHLTADQREFLLTGISAEEWTDFMFGPDEPIGEGAL